MTCRQIFDEQYITWSASAILWHRIYRVHAVFITIWMHIFLPNERDDEYPTLSAHQTFEYINKSEELMNHAIHLFDNGNDSTQ